MPNSHLVQCNFMLHPWREKGIHEVSSTHGTGLCSSTDALDSLLLHWTNISLTRPRHGNASFRKKRVHRRGQQNLDDHLDFDFWKACLSRYTTWFPGQSQSFIQWPNKLSVSWGLCLFTQRFLYASSCLKCTCEVHLHVLMRPVRNV